MKTYIISEEVLRSIRGVSMAIDSDYMGELTPQHVWETAAKIQSMLDAIITSPPAEPVAWQHPMDIGRHNTALTKPASDEWIPLYIKDL